MPATKPLARPDLTIVELDGEAVIYDDASGNLHYLNPTATLLLGLCDGTATGRQLAAEIADALDLPSDRVDADVRHALRAFRKSDLLVPPSRGRAVGG